ncbi:hypothetical protein BpHYR1_038856 [Brachionus plicatilis]|uniref:Uncharacterized protein n=1 Tax=Brachionus plicatilis TaxID=10195 RepID=A0A3M7RQK5_BRAPC|nr:hypothetical protein BpHYR1_038856 [Brachionus plicatilis]
MITKKFNKNKIVLIKIVQQTVLINNFMFFFFKTDFVFCFDILMFKINSVNAEWCNINSYGLKIFFDYFGQQKKYLSLIIPLLKNLTIKKNNIILNIDFFKTIQLIEIRIKIIVHTILGSTSFCDQALITVNALNVLVFNLKKNMITNLNFR